MLSSTPANRTLGFFGGNSNVDSRSRRIKLGLRVHLIGRQDTGKAAAELVLSLFLSSHPTACLSNHNDDGIGLSTYNKGTTTFLVSSRTLELPDYSSTRQAT